MARQSRLQREILAQLNCWQRNGCWRRIEFSPGNRGGLRRPERPISSVVDSHVGFEFARHSPWQTCEAGTAPLS